MIFSSFLSFLLPLEISSVIIIASSTATSPTTTAAVQATTNNDDAIEKEMNKRNDETKEMAEEALLKGTCLGGLEIMKILAHPDREVAILGTEIPAC